jgi:anaerobic ribonucleoside-triphosphate reductase activating protein
MYYGAIKKSDIANGEGIRTTLFVSGCRNKCKNCFNPETWSFTYGELFTDQVAEGILKTFESAFVAGMTVLGGEPMEPENQVELVKLFRAFKHRFPNKTLWVYTGNLYEELTAGVGNHFKCIDVTEELLSYVDILVDGRYEEEKKSLGIRFRGSTNQRIIDMNKTRAEGSIVIWEGCKLDRTYSTANN